MRVRLERGKAHQKYFLKDGTQVSGASGISKLGDSIEGLLYYNWKEGKEGRAYRQSVQSAADSGTIAHFMVDCHLAGNEPDLREFEQYEIDRATNSFNRFLEFWDREKLSPLFIEKQLVSEVHRYGGTLDLVARDEDGKKVLLEWKSPKAIYNSHRWQVAAYEILENENSDKPLDRRAIVRIGREPTDALQVHWITQEQSEQHRKVFLAQLNLFHTLRENK